MSDEMLNFEMDLWGQYNKLHERLIKKKDYLINLVKSLEPIYNVFKDLEKKLEIFKIIPDPTISKALYMESDISDSNEKQLYGISLTIETFINSLRNLIDNNNKTFFLLISGLENLIKKIKLEKDEFNNFIKCLKILSDNKSTMDKNMKYYHQKMFAAERSVLDLKRVEIIQLSINNDMANIQNKNLLEEKANQLTNDSVKPFKTYLESVKKANETREESIERQRSLLYKYQNLEEEVGKTNANISNIILSFEGIYKEAIEKSILDFRNIVNNININKDIKQLIMDYKGNSKPEETILFIHFPSVINFNESDDNKTFEIYKKTIEFIKEKEEQEYPDYDEELEIKKNDLRECLYKLFKEFDKEKSQKIFEYIMDENVHFFFLILLSKLRTNSRYDKDKVMIDFLGNILNYILDKAEVTNNLKNAKNCIILSQTFYYDNNGEKYYLLEKIKKHKWISKPTFWVDFGELMVDIELKKILEKYPDITKEDIMNNTEIIASNNLQKKLSDIMYSQILPFVNNMKDFEINLKSIVEITEDILNKYNFLSKEEKETVFTIISDNKEEIDKYREEYKKLNNQKNTIEKNNEINNNVKIENNENNLNNENKSDKNNKTSSTNSKEIENKPNKIITNNFKKVINKVQNENDNNNKKIKKESKEIKKENKEIKKENKEIKKESKEIKKENKEIKKENKESKKESKEIKKENKEIKKENKEIIKENKEIKKENKEIKKENKESKKENKENKKEIKENEYPIPMRSVTMELPINNNSEKTEQNENENSVKGLFHNLKNKFFKNDKKNGYKEEKKDKNEIKTEKVKEETPPQKSLMKMELEKKMMGMDSNREKIHTLKPIPKIDKNNNNKNEDTNKQTNTIASNPFGVVLKKIDKTKK